MVFFLISFLPILFLSYINFNSAKELLVKDVQEKLVSIITVDVSRIREAGTSQPLLASIASDYTDLGSTGEIIIAKRGPDGSVQYITPRRFEKLAVAKSSIISETLSNHESFLSGVTDYRGKPIVAVTRYISDLGLAVEAKMDIAEAYQPVNNLRDTIIVFSFVFLMVILMIALLFVHSITAPIINIVSVSKQVTAGDLSKRAAVLSNDEIGELATSFNKMISVLKELHEVLEKKFEERTKQLEVANKDLESFSYSVSHDLRAPLRAVDGFSKILIEDYSNKLDADGRHVVDTIRASTKQMGNLIDDLLSFSRLGRQEIKASDVDMTTLVKTVFDELKIINPARVIQFTCEDLPVAHADPALMRQVWANLLSNAIKFTNKKEIAVINVGSTTDKNNIVYFVKDNGVGFDMKYADKLFVVFQRLHSN